MPKARVIIHEERCKSCELCTTACPQSLLVIAQHMNAGGYRPVSITDQDKCKGCALCAIICPDVALEVEKEEKA